nr:ribonuclease H-like domain-containing protein [Tanacetum cinerariifolium]
MHNNIMEAGLRDRPPMLATGGYPQWPVEATDDSLAIPEHMIVETPMNMSPENKDHVLAEKEAIHLILTRIRDEIYSTIDACQTAQEMWEAIERLQQGESLNIQDRTVNVAGAREKVGSPVVQQSGIQCLNCKEFSHFAKECRKPKRVKDSAYHKEKMLLCKQAKQGVPLQTEQYDWLADTNEEVDEQELKAYYSYMAKIQEVPTADTCTNSEPVEQCKAILAETSKSLRKSISVRDSCLVALQTKQTEFEKYKAFNDRTIDYDKLEHKLNETLGQLALKDIEIKEGLKTKAYEISVVKQKHDELIKHSLLTKSHYAGLVKQKTKVITDLKLREEHDIDKMISMEKQLKFLNEIVYKRSQSIQTIHMMSPNVPTYNGRPTFANPRYLKQAQSEIPCLYAFPYDQSTHANRLILDGEETLALERESRSKLNKDLVRPYDYTTLNSLYEIFKPSTQEYDHQLQDKNIAISELKKLIEKGKGKYVDTKFDKPSVVRQPNAQRIPKPSVLGKPAPFSNSLERRYFPKTKLVLKTNVSKGLSKPVTAQTLPQIAGKAVSNTNVLKPGMYRINNKTAYTRAPQLPQTVRNTNPCVSTSTGVNHKPNVSRPHHKSNKSRDKVLPSNSQVKLEMHADLKYAESLEKEIDELESDKAEFSNMYDVILQEYLKAQLQDKNIAISELKKLIKKGKGKSVDTEFDIPPVVRQPNSQRIPKPSVLGKPAPFSNSLQRTYFPKSMSVSKANVSEGLSKPVTAKTLAQTARQPTISRLSQNNALKRTLSLGREKPRLFQLNFDYINLLSKNDIVIGLPMLKYVKDQLCSSCELSKAKISSFKSKAISSSKGRLNLLHMDLCGPMRVASINGKKYILRTRMIVESIYIRFDEIKEVYETSVANDTSGLVPQRQKTSDYDNPDPSISAPSTPINVHAEENTDNQAEEGEHLQDDEFTNPFCAPAQEEAESSSHNIEQVCGNPSRLVQTRRKLATDPEMCMCALTVSTAKPKNVKEAMADSAWIKAMQEELYQFDRLQ